MKFYSIVLYALEASIQCFAAVPTALLKQELESLNDDFLVRIIIL